MPDSKCKDCQGCGWVGTNVEDRELCECTCPECHGPIRSRFERTGRHEGVSWKECGDCETEVPGSEEREVDEAAIDEAIERRHGIE
jgi:hypothetical protein